MASSPLPLLHDRLNKRSLELTQQLLEDKGNGLWEAIKQWFSHILEYFGLYRGMRKVLHFQAALEVISQYQASLPADQKIKLETVSYEEAKAKLGEIPEWRRKFKGVFSAMYKGTFNSASSGVPQSAALAVTLGEATKAQTDLMLIVQGLERTRRVLKGEEAQSLDALRAPVTTPEAWLKSCVLGKEGRPYVGGAKDSAPLVFAQTLNHTSFLLKHAASAFPEKKDVLWSQPVHDALASLVAAQYEGAVQAVNSKQFSMPQSRRIRLSGDFKALAEEIKPQQVSVESAMQTVKGALDALAVLVKEHSGVTDEQRKEVVALLEKRGQGISRGVSQTPETFHAVVI